MRDFRGPQETKSHKELCQRESHFEVAKPVGSYVSNLVSRLQDAAVGNNKLQRKRKSITLTNLQEADHASKELKRRRKQELLNKCAEESRVAERTGSVAVVEPWVPHFVTSGTRPPIADEEDRYDPPQFETPAVDLRVAKCPKSPRRPSVSALPESIPQHGRRGSKTIKREMNETAGTNLQEHEVSTRQVKMEEYDADDEFDPNRRTSVKLCESQNQVKHETTCNNTRRPSVLGTSRRSSTSVQRSKSRTLSRPDLSVTQHTMQDPPRASTPLSRRRSSCKSDLSMSNISGIHHTSQLALNKSKSQVNVTVIPAKSNVSMTSIATNSTKASTGPSFDMPIAIERALQFIVTACQNNWGMDCVEALPLFEDSDVTDQQLDKLEQFFSEDRELEEADYDSVAILAAAAFFDQRYLLPMEKPLVTQKLRRLPVIKQTKEEIRGALTSRRYAALTKVFLYLSYISKAANQPGRYSSILAQRLTPSLTRKSNNDQAEQTVRNFIKNYDTIFAG